MEEKIKRGEAQIREAPCSIDDITDNAVIIIRNPDVNEYAVMNLDPLDSPRATDILDDLLSEYRTRISLEDGATLAKTEAFLIGGDFMEHTYMEDRGIYVFTHHDIAWKKAEEALLVSGIRFTRLHTDNRATKSISIESRGSFEEPKCDRLGDNAYDAVMSRESYEMTIAKYDEVV